MVYTTIIQRRKGYCGGSEATFGPTTSHNSVCSLYRAFLIDPHISTIELDVFCLHGFSQMPFSWYFTQMFSFYTFQFCWTFWLL